MSISGCDMPAKLVLTHEQSAVISAAASISAGTSPSGNGCEAAQAASNAVMSAAWAKAGPVAPSVAANSATAANWLKRIRYPPVAAHKTCPRPPRQTQKGGREAALRGELRARSAAIFLVAGAAGAADDLERRPIGSSVSGGSGCLHVLRTLEARGKNGGEIVPVLPDRRQGIAVAGPGVLGEPLGEVREIVDEGVGRR